MIDRKEKRQKQKQKQKKTHPHKRRQRTRNDHNIGPSLDHLAELQETRIERRADGRPLLRPRLGQLGPVGGREHWRVVALLDEVPREAREERGVGRAGPHELLVP